MHAMTANETQMLNAPVTRREFLNGSPSPIASSAPVTARNIKKMEHISRDPRRTGT